MPQASDEDREWYINKFGSINDGIGMRWLLERGFKVHRFCWIMPEGRTETTEEERRVIFFLVDEWDWGGVIDPP